MAGSDPAFPRSPKTIRHERGSCCKVIGDQPGLTKRELIATLALQGFVQKPITLIDNTEIFQLRAEWAVRQADALLAALASDSSKEGK